jgi:hypothetical protein
MADRIPMMPPKRFWDVIEASKHPDRDEFLQRLHRQLVALSLDEVVGFDTRLWDYLGLANRIELWNASEFLTFSASEDGFRYFCCWLISEGRQAYDRALADPDSLADLPPSPRYDLERLMSSASLAWTEKTGQDWRSLYEAKQNAEETPWPDLVDQDWDVNDEDEVRRHFPRLFARRSQE